MKFENKSVVVTGAAGGIGRTIAERFLAEGAYVVAGDIDGERLEQTVADLGRASGRIVGVDTDVSNSTQVNGLIDIAVETHGRIDVLCNNAGIEDYFTTVANISDDLWSHVMAVNLSGAMFASRRAIPQMVKQGGGTILNIASVAGLRGGLAGAAYTASKHALVGLTKNIAWQYALQGIRCVAICPAGVNTGIAEQALANADPAGLSRLQPLATSAVLSELRPRST